MSVSETRKADCVEKERGAGVLRRGQGRAACCRARDSDPRRTPPAPTSPRPGAPTLLRE